MGFVNECYLRMVEVADAGINDRAHFLALAARAMRQAMQLPLRSCQRLRADALLRIETLKAA